MKTGDASDEELVSALARGDDGALGPLYRRHVPIVYKMAAQALGADAAEDVVQEVFAYVWKNAGAFDPSRGEVRPWILQIARSRVLNELRRRSRKPESTEQGDTAELEELTDGARPPDQALWDEYRRSALRHAIGTLPPPQRQALSLAFFEELTHEQVSQALKVPLGTTKTRIRSGMQRLRRVLAAVAAILVATAAARLALDYSSKRAEAMRIDSALRMVTASDVQVLRLAATSHAPAAAHGNYRMRPGSRIAVLTFSDLPSPPNGQAYQGWIRRAGSWISLGLAVPDATGRGLIVYEDAAPLDSPEALELTLEPAHGSSTPSAAPLISWSAN